INIRKQNANAINTMIIHDVVDIAFTLFPDALKVVNATKAKDAPNLCAMFSITELVKATTLILFCEAFDTTNALTAGVINPTPIPIQLIDVNRKEKLVSRWTKLNIIIPIKKIAIAVPIIILAVNNFN